jgi:LacI family transcriptional regulator
MEDVARESSVTISTVSRVINGSARVLPTTERRVLAAIRKLGYTPNDAARALAGQPSRTIGLMVPSLADPFFSVCAHGVEQVSAQNSYSTIVLSSEGNRAQRRGRMEMINSRSLAGLVVVPYGDYARRELTSLQDSGLPIVILDRTLPKFISTEVMVENRYGARSATDHLIGHGYRDIVCVGYDEEFSSIRDRLTGYQEAMEEYGLQPKFFKVNSPQSAVAALRRCKAASRPLGVFALNNLATIFALEALRAERLRIPNDVAFIGFDDAPWASLLSVPLTVVRQPALELGRHAALLIFEALKQIRHGATISVSTITLPTELIVRNSCGCS